MRQRDRGLFSYSVALHRMPAISQTLSQSLTLPMPQLTLSLARVSRLATGPAGKARASLVGNLSSFHA